MSNYVFSEMEIDAIGEISNICLGGSASTLSMLVRQTVEITPPNVEIVEKSEYTKNVSSKKVFVKVDYVEGVQGCSILMLEEQDAKAIADLMMGSDGHGMFAQMELGEMHLSAVSEAMNQMMGSAATSMSVMLERKTDISTPDTKFMEGGQYIACEFPLEELPKYALESQWNPAENTETWKYRTSPSEKVTSIETVPRVPQMTIHGQTEFSS